MFRTCELRLANGDLRGAALRVVLLLIACTAVIAAAQSNDDAVARELIRLTNKDRADAGVAPLKSNEKLAAAALPHCQEMARRKELMHQFGGEPPVDARIAAARLNFDATGENIASATTRRPASADAARINDILMHSPPHRANILNPNYNAIGVAIVHSEGETWAVEDFAHAYAETSATDIESTAAAAFNSARKKAGLPRAQVVARKDLRALACNEGITPRGLLNRFPDASSALVYTTWDASKLQGSTAEAARDPAFRSVALGACAVSGRHGHGSYRIVMLAF
jgi:Cysteine-rich secretory protein family